MIIATIHRTVHAMLLTWSVISDQWLERINQVLCVQASVGYNKKVAFFFIFQHFTVCRTNGQDPELFFINLTCYCINRMYTDNTINSGVKYLSYIF